MNTFSKFNKENMKSRHVRKVDVAIFDLGQKRFFPW